MDYERNEDVTETKIRSYRLLGKFLNRLRSPTGLKTNWIQHAGRMKTDRVLNCWKLQTTWIAEHRRTLKRTLGD
jgi:hypothetical protein